MNRSETAYAGHLDTLVHVGELLLWRFECISLRLGHNCFYHPDFYVVAADHTIEMHEVKGHMEDDARVKLSAAASQYPEMKFILARVTRKRGVHLFDVSEVLVK